MVLVTPVIERVVAGLISVIQGLSAIMGTRLAMLVDHAVGCMPDVSLHSMQAYDLG